MKIHRTIKAINTSACYQNDQGEKYEVPCDYLAMIESEGNFYIVPLKVISLADVDGYQRFEVRDNNGRVIPDDEIKERFGKDEPDFSDSLSQWSTLH